MLHSVDHVDCIERASPCKPAHDFGYLIEKVVSAPFSSEPFRHVYIEDFFSAEHFAQIVGSEEIRPPIARDDDQLIRGLYEKGFKVIPFPGCVTDKADYIAWHERGRHISHHSACEGFGMALRLYEVQSPVLSALRQFVVGEAFNQAVAQKFGVDLSACFTDGGIQKYLDGYEISPHPDIRKKAVTFMVNINPWHDSESLDFHTHYMRLTRSKSYVQQFWEGNPQFDRAWVPWNWAETVIRQERNNSIVLFAPSNDTLHGVKADYDHLKTQRTQLYGNIWYEQESVVGTVEWEGLDVARAALSGSKAVPGARLRALQDRVSRWIPYRIRSALDRSLGDRIEVGKRRF
jgi:hypothetical protein